jgi:hypothetical protein
MAETKEWTLMFYFASDNPLAPGIVSQLKAIKQAGFHSEANVIAQFDPQPQGTPTHIFDVNLINKLKHPDVPQIGFTGSAARDPLVSNLLEDKLWRDQKDRNKHLITERLKESLRAQQQIAYNPPPPPPGSKEVPRAGSPEEAVKPGPNGSKVRVVELNPKESLEAFLTFCRESYPARHYMLFILGHGVVVGNDLFLFDEHADRQSLSLRELGDVLNGFKEKLAADAEFELISFHSCSVSSLEVAYEVAGTANYMLASQGPAFVGSWPYRQILMRVFENIDDLRRLEGGAPRRQVRKHIEAVLLDIFSFCFDNSTDFLLAGYSFDLCLCNLNKVREIKSSLLKLSDALVAGLADNLVRDFIVLAHWESQSHWHESYTDLHDFCFCLRRKCLEFEKRFGEEAGRVLGRTHTTLWEIMAACDEVQSGLEKRASQEDDKIIVASEFAGPAYQYSHGLSVFFPWSERLSDRVLLSDYEEYKFNDTKWLDFLLSYFEQTKRASRRTEMLEARRAAGSLVPEEDEAQQLAEDLASLVFNEEGLLSGATTYAGPGKINPADPTGDDCNCQTIKNYPRDTRARRLREQTAPPADESDKSVPLSQSRSILP